MENPGTEASLYTESVCDGTRIGILGGTFDPIHYGHLRIAEAAREQLSLDCVLFVPNRDPVHKDHVPASAEHRFAMATLAVSDHPHFRVSRIELDRDTPSYSVETLERLHSSLPHADFFFITGADEILSLKSWKSSDRLLELATFVAACRPGYDLEELPRRLEPALLERIVVLKTPEYPVQSTEMRRRISEGKSIRYDTPHPVVQHILKFGLYRGPLPRPLSVVGGQ